MGVLKVNVDGQWIEISQTGPPGPTGPQGPQGIQGVPGPSRTIKYFALWRTTGYTLNVDGDNELPFTNKDDPFNMTANLTSFVAPTSGLVLFSSSVLLSFSGTPTSMNLFSYIKENGTVIRRGNQITGSIALSWYQCLLTTQVMVTAGRSYTMSAYTAVPGFGKSVFGDRPYTYFEGVYL